MRTRSVDTRTRQSHFLTYTWNGCTPSSTSASTLCGPIGHYEVMNDVLVPGYHARSRRGEVFFNPMSHFVSDSTLNGGGSHGWEENGTHDCSGVARKFRAFESRGIADHIWAIVRASGNLSTPIVATSPTDYSVVNDYINELSTDVRSSVGRSKTNQWETVAEAHEAVGIIPSLCDNARKIIDAKARKYQRLVKTPADLYLTYSYGIRPIVQSIGAALDGVQKKVGQVRESTRRSGSLTFSSNSNGNFYGSPTRWYWQETARSTVGIRVMSLDSYYASLMSNVGFRSKDLITLPWELVPYSFVVDWFTNVGSVIGSVTPSFGVNHLGSCVVTREEVDYTFANSYQVDDSGYHTVGTDSSSVRVLSRNTIRSPGLPAPSLVIRNDFRFTNFDRATQALALLVQKMKFPWR